MERTPLHLGSKLSNTGDSIFSTMSALARQHNALNLSQGFPDFDVSPKLIELVNKYMKKGFNQYAPMPGVIALREALSVKIKNLYNQEYCPIEEITITPGATQAIYCAISAIINEGDEAIIIDPAYDSYAPSIILNGGIPVHVELNASFEIDWPTLKSRISSKTKLLIINNPHNPTGACLNKSDLESLEKLCNETDIFILSDEVYEHISFEKKHESVLAYPELMQRSIAVFSFGKVFHATGWKLGYLVAPNYITKEIRKIYQFVSFSANTAIQYALADYIKNEEHYLCLNDFFKAKRDRFISGIKGSRFDAVSCQGTYFQLLNYNTISQEKDILFANNLVLKGIASIPISVFYKNKTDRHYLRFCFAKSDKLIDNATELLCTI